MGPVLPADEPGAHCHRDGSETSPALDDAGVRRYLEDGFAMVPDVLGAAELAAVARDLVALATGAYPCEALAPLSGRPVAGRGARAHPVHPPAALRQPRHPQVRDSSGDRRRAQPASPPPICPPGWWDGGVKCMQSMLFVKPPGLPGPGLAPGRDLHPHPRPLADRRVDRHGRRDRSKTAACGSSPGSHRSPATSTRQRDHGTTPTSSTFAGEAYGFDEGEARSPVEVKAGSAGVLQRLPAAPLAQEPQRRLAPRAGVPLHEHDLAAALGRAAEDAIKAGQVTTARADYRGVIPVRGQDPAASRGYLEQVPEAGGSGRRGG